MRNLKSLLSSLLNALCYSFIAIAAMYSNSASASCAWSGASSNFSVAKPIVFEAAGYKMLANNRWYDDTRYPVGTLMGVSTISLKALNCAGLVELKSQHVNVVYVPPANAVPTGSGYRAPTSSDGVAIEIEFPDGTPYAGGLLLGTSAGLVSAGGIMTVTGSRIPPVLVRLSVVKTGKFTKDDAKSAIRVDGGLGWFRYYSDSDATLASASEDQLQMPTSYGSSKDGEYLGSALAPSCQVSKLGGVSLVTGLKVISLSPVSTDDFSGIGPIEKSAKAQQFSFSCNGTSDTKPVVYFEATYPLNAGVEGVGMPDANSDIGIQILFNDQPVKFGQNSPVLGWNLTPLTGGVNDPIYGVFGPQGKYCTSNCGADMDNANWISGEVGSGNNDNIDATVTFKYYQTTSQSPQPKSFSVPFTVTLDVQ